MSTFGIKSLHIIADLLHEDRKEQLKLLEDMNVPMEVQIDAQEYLVLVDVAIAEVRSEYEKLRQGAVNIIPFDELFVN
jgi:hypothetical protein